MAERENVPTGWEYNPSTWSQRLPIIVLAAIGFLIALYLGFFQLKVIKRVWDPFFDSHKILTSAVSFYLPVPDAILGALGYLADAVSGAIGGTGRWRSMPWIVILFGVAVGPLGSVSIMLVIFQPVLYDAWCTLCLATALISVLMIGPAMDEVLASLQYLKRMSKQKRSVWRAFWGLSH